METVSLVAGRAGKEVGPEGQVVTKNEILKEKRERGPKAAVRDGVPRVCTGHGLERETQGPAGPFPETGAG